MATLSEDISASQAQPVTPTLAAALHLKTPTGVLVTEVEPQGPAVGALIIGDVLLTVGTTPVTFKDLTKITARLVPKQIGSP